MDTRAAGSLQSFKVSLCNYCILVVPNVNDWFQLHTDAAGVGVGAVLHVIRDCSIYPIAFFSRQLRGVELWYSVTEKEVVAVITAVKHFEHYLYSIYFNIFTDHQPLVFLVTSKRLNHQLMGMALRLEHLDFTIHYRCGEDNGNADAMSRQSWDPSDESTGSRDSAGSSRVPTCRFLASPVSILGGRAVGLPISST